MDYLNQCPKLKGTAAVVREFKSVLKVFKVNKYIKKYLSLQLCQVAGGICAWRNIAM